MSAIFREFKLDYLTLKCGKCDQTTTTTEISTKDTHHLISLKNFLEFFIFIPSRSWGSSLSLRGPLMGDLLMAIFLVAN